MFVISHLCVELDLLYQLPSFLVINLMCFLVYRRTEVCCSLSGIQSWVYVQDARANFACWQSERQQRYLLENMTFNIQ